MPYPSPAPSSAPDLDALLRAAKDSLARADALDATVPEGSHPTPPDIRMPADLPEEPTSLWGKIKSVAHYSPIVSNIGDQFAHDVDPNETRDSKALAGTYGPLDTLKSFLAGAGGGFFDTVRNTATPAGLASLVSGESAPARVVQGVGGALFSGEGAETLLNDQASTQDKALGTLNLALGLHGAMGAIGPHEPVPQKPGIPKPERYAPNTSAASHVPNPDDAALPFTTGVEPHLPNTSAQPSDVALPFDPGVAPAPLAQFDRYMPNTGAANAAPVPASVSPSISPDESFSPSPVPAKPRLSAQEVSNMLSGRAKFADANPGASLPPGASDELDRMGVEYGRTQGELKRLLGMPDADPTNVDQMQQGARELGSRLRKAAKGYAAPPDAPPVASAPESASAPASSPAAPTSLADMLQQSLDAQAADQAARTSAAPAPAPGREGHFTLPKANVPDDVYEKIRASKGIAPSPLERAERPITGGGEAPVSNAPADSFAAEYPLNTEGGGVDASNPERGAADPKLLANLLRVPAGAAIGAYFDPEDRSRGAMIGGGLGAASLALPTENLLSHARQYQGAAMLSRPATVAKVLAGNLGGGTIRAIENSVAQGDLTPLKRMLGEFSNVPRMMEDAKADFQHPADNPRFVETHPQTGALSIPGRVIGAADNGTRQAMIRSGMDPHEAARVTMQVDPETPVFQSLLNAQRRHESLQTLMPFVKTGFNLAEQGLIEPLQGAARMMKGEYRPMDAVKLASMLGIGALGAATSEKMNDLPLPVQGIATAATGPYAVPMALGRVLGHALRSKDPGASYDAAANELTQQVPFAEGVDVRRSALMRRAVPGIVQDAAHLVDPQDRDTSSSQGFFAPLLARLPFLSKLLPPKGSAHVSHRLTDE